MIPWSFWWESMRLFFIEHSCVPPVFFWDHLFEGFLRFVHGLLGQFGCHCSFSENGARLLFFCVYCFPLFFCHYCQKMGFRMDTGYYHWLAGFVQGCVLPVNNRFEGG